MAEKVVGIQFKYSGSAKLADEINDITYELGELRKQANVLKNQKDKAGFIEMSRDIDKLKAKQKELQQSLKENEAELGSLIDKVRVGGVSIGEFKGAITNATGSLKIIKTAVIANTSAIRLFTVALAGTGIGLIVVALASLFTYLTKTQRGMDLVARAGAVVKSVFDNLIERAAILGEGLLLLGSGKIAAGISKMKDAFVGLGKEIVEDGKAALRLQETSQALRDEEKGLTVIIAERNRKIKELNLISEDTNKSQAERLAATKEALAVAQQVSAMETHFLDKKIAQLQEVQALGESTAEEEQELADLIASRDQKKEASLEKQTTINNKLNIILAGQKTTIEEITKGPLQVMQEKLKDIGDLIGGGSLTGDALRDKIKEMLNLKSEVDAMEESIRRITEEVSRTAVDQLDPLTGGRQVELPTAIDSLNPEVEKRRLTEEEIMKMRKEYDKMELEQYWTQLEAIKKLEEDKKNERLEVWQSFSTDLGGIIEGLVGGQIKTLQDFEQALLVSLVDSVEKAINVLLAELFARLIAKNPLLGTAAFAAASGLIKGFFSGVKNQITKKNEKGGLTEGAILQGPSHAQGGIPIPHSEFEGDEAIVNKRSTQLFKPLLSAINSYNGWGKKFARGGLTVGNTIPSFLGLSQSNRVAGVGSQNANSFLAEESIYALAGALGNAVKSGIGEGLTNAGRNNERYNIYRKTSSI